MGFIYIGKGVNDDSFKIGVTNKQEEERIKQHRTANPSFEYHSIIKSDAPRKLETFLHCLFESKRVRDTKEWFALTPEDIPIAKETAIRYEAEDLPRIAKVDQLRTLTTSDRFVEPIPSTEEDYLQLRFLYEQAFRIEQDILRVEGRLKIQTGANAGIVGYVSWKSQVQQMFDSQLFKKEFPDVYSKYLRPSVRRCFNLK